MDFFNAGEEEAMRLHSFMHVHRAKVKQVCKTRESCKKSARERSGKGRNVVVILSFRLRFVGCFGLYLFARM